MSTKLHQFYASFGSGTYIFSNGKPAIFIGGVYRTAIQSEIDELNKEISLNHPHLYVKKGEEVIDAEDLDPISVLKKRHFAEFMAQQQAAHKNPGRDMGNNIPSAVAVAGNTIAAPDLMEVVNKANALGKTAGIKVSIPSKGGITGMATTSTISDTASESNGAAVSSVK